jgi:hypothetical protein
MITIVRDRRIDVSKQAQPAPISAPNILLRHTVSAGGHTKRNTPNGVLLRRNLDEVQRDAISQLTPTSHPFCVMLGGKGALYDEVREPALALL